MEAIVVAGVANAETTLRVDGFPLVYAPVRYPTFGIRTTPGGVGLNVAAALAALGRPVRLAALIGQDPAGALVTAGLAARGLPRDWVLETADATPQSVVLVDPDGRTGGARSTPI